ncbi:MAG: hypothetical protein ACI9CE_000971 [Flavobacterium sp.]|jgi:uncharacterized protein YyaL (SSP411 family)
MQLIRISTALILLSFGSLSFGSASQDLIKWQIWSEAAFNKAKKENKLVLLNLEAVWCHWCHVMDQETYSNPEVAQLINQHFIPIKVDHDAQPDLANQYRDYGWPATIFLNADGTDLVKRAGYIQPASFAKLLLAIVADPTPERSARPKILDAFALEPTLDPAIYQELVQRHQALFDSVLGGLKSNQKTLDRDHVEFALMRARLGDAFEANVAMKTIEASFALIDPEWGGIYQYSTYGDWHHPHFEKIMTSQAGFMRIYALAYQQFNKEVYLEQSNAIVAYLDEFLRSPTGAFYTSQDADLTQGEKATTYFALSNKARRALGIPRIDTNIYARENGLAIEALTALYEASNDPSHLVRATAAASEMLRSHQLQSGGFKHNAADKTAQYLGDTLHMGAAFLQLHKVTADRHWLALAENCGDYIRQNFKADTAGYLSGLTRPGLPVQALPNIEENIKTTRFLNLLAHYTGEKAFREAAEHGMRYLATADIAFARIEDSGILIAAQELANPPPHFTIVSKKGATESESLFQIGRSQAGWNKRLEWWDIREGPLRNPDVTYPAFDKAAGYACVNRLCSTPTFTDTRYQALVDKITGPKPL